MVGCCMQCTPSLCLSADISRLTPIMDKLPPESVTFGQLKVCMAILQYEFGIDSGAAADDGG